MDSKKFTLFASILEDLNDNKRNLYFMALNIEYHSQLFSITANEMSKAIDAFHQSTIFNEFADRHKRNGLVYSYIRIEGDPTFHRIDRIPSSASTND